MDAFGERVVVIMPTYNGENFIEEQICSIQNQSFRDFILYIYDDLSTDQTAKIAADLARKDERIHLFRNIFQKGVIKNINDALSEIDSDIYFLADQDDIWLPEKMAKQLEVLQPDDVVMSFSNLSLVDKNGLEMGIDFWSSQEINVLEASQSEIIAIKTMVTGCTMAFKKRLLDIALPIPEQATMHDHWLSFFATKIGRIVPIPEELVLYRQHSNNIIGASITPKQRRHRRYEGCVTYRDFKTRKYQSYRDLLVSNRLFEQRLKDHNLDHPPLENYIAFYDRMTNRQWVAALGVALRIKKHPNSNSFIRTLILTFFFPVVFLFLKFIQNAAKLSEKLKNDHLDP
jgi:glycosyltransferase involved in cell wall biosynthesis